MGMNNQLFIVGSKWPELFSAYL